MVKVGRLGIAAMFALLVTLALFVLMPALIRSPGGDLTKQEQLRLADIVMPLRTIDARLDVNKPDKPEVLESPPSLLDQPNFDDLDLSSADLDLAPPIDMALDLQSGIGFSGSDGEFLPVVKVAPMYPRRANSRGIEGYCTVEYTVTKSGAVRNVQVVDCNPSGFFERVSVKAASKFKYKPRVVDGEPVDVVGVQNRFTYELEK